ncbi:hypothetical protein B566_EDAN001902 [Ephemera danica]|nr:hypothetical protein B566_EDAN001902 [Ephemera danica]
MMHILSEYEAVNKGLTSLVESYEKEHGDVRLECTAIIGENQRLSSELQTALEACQHISCTDEVTNLKQQLVLTLQEKDAALELWKLAVGEVSNLEKLLKIFQERKSTDSGYSSVNSRLEKARALSTAESQLVESKALLARERLVRADVESSLFREREAHRNTSQQLEVASQQLHLAEEEHSKHLELQNQESQQIKALTASRDELERAWNHNKVRLQQALGAVEEGRQRVAEALTLVDTACASRDQALAGESRVKEEVLRLQGALQELTDEATSRVKREVEQIKQQCNSRIHTLLVDMKKLQEEVAEQRNLAERAMKGQKQAEEALEHRTQELRNAQARQLPLENRLASLHAQLADAERRAHTADCAMQAAHAELNEERASHRRDENGTGNKVRKLEKQISSLASELEETKRRAHENVQDMSAREQILTARLQTLEKNSVATITELHQIVTAHQNMPV